MNLSQDQLAAILGPLWVAFEIAKERIEDMREEAEAQPAGETRRMLSDLDDALIYLEYRSRDFEPDGLMTVLQTAHGPVMWPNVYPQPVTRSTYLREWIDRQPDIKAKREARREAFADRLQAAMTVLQQKRTRLATRERVGLSA